MEPRLDEEPFHGPPCPPCACCGEPLLNAPWVIIYAHAYGTACTGLPGDDDGFCANIQVDPAEVGAVLAAAMSRGPANPPAAETALHLHCMNVFFGAKVIEMEHKLRGQDGFE